MLGTYDFISFAISNSFFVGAPKLIPLLDCFFIASAFSYDEEAKEEIVLSTPEQIGALSSRPCKKGNVSKDALGIF